MKILWITNLPTCEIAEKINVNKNNGGGWLQQLSMQLSKVEDNELAIMFPVDSNRGYNNIEVNNIKAYPLILGEKTLNTIYEEKIESVIIEFNPDVIHIWGTEYPHTYQIVKLCMKLNIIDKVVISIQGLVSICAKHYNAFISDKYFNKSSFRDIIRNDSLRKQRKQFERRGQYEIKAIENAKNIIGRTDWDEACTKQINSNIKYYFCNETLRETFYNHTWNIDKCEKYSIFLSQSSYPIKGLHLMFEALSKIIVEFPESHLYVTGKNRLTTSLKEKILFTQYDNYLLKTIKKYKLEKNVTFLDNLSEKDMCNQFLKSHAFVSASSIENSPNSLGEAMILGVPSVASDVGGVKNMLEHGKEGYIYPADEPYMLAHYVMKIFENDDVALEISRNARKHALQTHNADMNLNRLVEIYKEIIGESNNYER